MNTLKFGNGEWYGKKDTILAYNDENSNFKPLPFSFNRASSATRVNKDGLIETVGSGEPRIDYKDDANGALLLEPTRSNKVSTSNDFNGGGWNLANLTATANQIISPDGTLNASKLEMTGDGSLRNQSEASFNDGYAYSIFVKKGNSRYVTIRSAFFTQSFNCGFDLDTLTSEANGKIEDYGNDWYRLSITKNISGDVDRSGFFYVYLPNSLGSQTSVSGNYIYAYGGQIEDGSYATSYIPTQSAIGTRVAEVCSQTPPSGIIGQTEGTIYFEYFKKNQNLSFISIDNNTSDNRIFIESILGSNNIRTRIISGGVASVDNTSGGLVNGINKIALGYANNNVVLYHNGIQIFTDNTATIPSTSILRLGVNVSNSFQLSDGINEVKLYNTRLSNAELQALTSN